MPLAEQIGRLEKKQQLLEGRKQLLVERSTAKTSKAVSRLRTARAACMKLGCEDAARLIHAKIQQLVKERGSSEAEPELPFAADSASGAVASGD